MYIHQTNKVQALSVMINNLKEVNRYWVEETRLHFNHMSNASGCEEQC